MKFDPQKHHRRSIRLKGYDYSQAGAYFVTLVAWRREMLFGEIVNGEMVLNEFGKIVQDEWERTGIVRREVELSTYIVMPNHFHGIVVLLSDTHRVSDVGATGRSPLPHGPAPKSLGSLMAGFKSSVTKQINIVRNVQGIPVWQRNYGACPELVEGNTSSATTAKWTASIGISNPTRPCGSRVTKTRIMFAMP